MLLCSTELNITVNDNEMRKSAKKLLYWPLKRICKFAARLTLGLLYLTRYYIISQLFYCILQLVTAITLLDLTRQQLPYCILPDYVTGEHITLHIQFVSLCFLCCWLRLSTNFNLYPQNIQQIVLFIAPGPSIVSQVAGTQLCNGISGRQLYRHTSLNPDTLCQM